jgi:hypothetical protein
MDQPRDANGRFGHKGEQRVLPDNRADRRRVLRKRFGNRTAWELYALQRRLGSPMDKYDPSQQRDKRGRWSAEGGGAAHLATSRIAEFGGFTVHPVTSDEPSEGFAVSKWPERSLVFKASGVPPARVARNIRTWLRSNQDMLSVPGVHIGGWHDTDSGQVYVDFSVVHPRSSRQAAIADAIAHNQKAIYSLHDQEEIDTGGTGEAMGKAADDSLKPVDRFFIPVAGKSIDELTDAVMENLFPGGVNEEDSDDSEE